MGRLSAKGGLRQTQIEAVVIRADGTREDLGVIARWHKNPLIRWWWALNDKIGRGVR